MESVEHIFDCFLNLLGVATSAAAELALADVDALGEHEAFVLRVGEFRVGVFWMLLLFLYTGTEEGLFLS